MFVGNIKMTLDSASVAPEMSSQSYDFFFQRIFYQVLLNYNNVIITGCIKLINIAI